MMTGIRLLADLFHVMALISLFIHFYKTRSRKGLSGCSLVLFALVYTTRYLDLFSYFISIYVFVMKVSYICVSYIFLYLTYFRFNDEQEEKHTEISFYFLLVPCIILAQHVNHSPSPLEILWAFSIYLEAVAIIPQMYHIYLKKKGESNVMTYMLFKFLYRGFYVIHWTYDNYFDKIAFFGGVIDVSIFIFFFVYYSLRIIPDGKKKKDFQSQFAANLPQVITGETLIKDELEKQPLQAGNIKGDEQSKIYCISNGKAY